MGDILSVNTNQSCINQQESWIDTSMFLQKDNYLGEFSSEAPSEDGGTIDEKALARSNLEVYSKVETDDSVQQAIEEELNAHINANDPHRDRAYTDSCIQNTSNNFTTQLDNLRTSLERLINNVQNTLVNNYALSSQLNDFVKKDGSTPFINPQKGVDPTSKQHLATKNYVDRVADPKIREYLNSEEFETLLNQVVNSFTQEYISQLTQEIEERCERKELVISQALNDLNTRINELSELTDQISDNSTSELNQFKDEVSNLLNDIEFITANALNDLNSRINNLEATTNDVIDNVISGLQSNITDNELAISSALNDLNTRVIEITNNLDVINPYLQLIPNRITISGKTLADELTQKETKFLELLFDNTKVYNLFQEFLNYTSININIVPESESKFYVILSIGDTNVNINITYNQQDQPECSISQFTSDDTIINNFINIRGTIIEDFLETIDKNTYTTYFID